MKRTKLADRELPNYTFSEEILNTETHLIGAIFGLLALVICFIYKDQYSDRYRFINYCIYCTSIIILYTVSTIYHGLKPSFAKKVMQVVDHCAIYILIAGSYTPILLGPIKDISPTIAWTLFAIEWVGGAVATVFTAIDHERFNTLSMVFYIGLGWALIFVAKTALQALSLPGFLYLLAGGIAYSIGTVFYSIDGKVNLHYMHSIFHIFVLLGTVLHYITILLYCH